MFPSRANFTELEVDAQELSGVLEITAGRKEIRARSLLLREKTSDEHYQSGDAFALSIGAGVSGGQRYMAVHGSVSDQRQGESYGFSGGYNSNTKRATA